MHSEGLYQFTSDEQVLGETVEVMRERLGIEAARQARPSVRDVACFTAAAAGGLATGIAFLALALTPISIAAWATSYLMWKRSKTLGNKPKGVT